MKRPFNSTHPHVYKDGKSWVCRSRAIGGGKLYNAERGATQRSAYLNWWKVYGQPLPIRVPR